MTTTAVLHIVGDPNAPGYDPSQNYWTTQYSRQFFADVVAPVAIGAIFGNGLASAAIDSAQKPGAPDGAKKNSSHRTKGASACH